MQLKFGSDEEASSFVGEIRDVCPCKETGADALQQRQSQSVGSKKRRRSRCSTSLEPPPPSSQRRVRNDASGSQLNSPYRTPTRSTQIDGANEQFRPTIPQPKRTAACFRPSDLSQTPIGRPFLFDETDDLFLVPRAAPPSSSSSQMSPSSVQPERLRTANAPLAPPPLSHDQIPQIDGVNWTDVFKHAAPSALYKADLTEDQLENLVEEIVQEEGFPRLCARVSRMWKARVLGAGSNAFGVLPK